MNYQPILEKLYPDGSVQGECGVFAHKLQQFPLVGDTIQSKTTAVKKYGYTAQMVQGGYDAGDILILNVGTPAGHVCFVNNIINGVMTLTESNWNLDLKVHHTRQLSIHDKSIVGCLRGNLLFAIPTFKQRVLVLCYNIPDTNMGQLKAGIQQYLDAIAIKTTDLTIEVDYAPTEANFTVITQTTNNTIYIQPADIAAEGEKVQQHNSKQYDVVCLIYDDSKMAPKPNHPIEAPVLIDGFNIIEIPIDWISNINNGMVDPLEIYPQAVEIFFAHEMSHANYFLVNKRGGFQLHDKTHDPMLSGYPNPIDYFLQYLMELKPFWSYIINQ